MRKIKLNTSVFDHIKRVNGRYFTIYALSYKTRYGTVEIHSGFESDGATYFPDIDSWFWLVHDKCKADRKFKDGSHCSNQQASVIAFDILIKEKRYMLAPCVFLATWLYGYSKRLIKNLTKIA